MKETKKEIKAKIAEMCDQIDSTDPGTPAYKKALLKLKELQQSLIATYARSTDCSSL